MRAWEWAGLFISGCVISFTFFFLVFVSMGWLKLPRAKTIEHPDGWYHVERMCHKTRMGGFGWKESCIDVKRRPR